MSDNKTKDGTLNIAKLTPSDFKPDNRVKWCPGCGDYSVLSQIQKAAPELGIPKENFVWVSGIGCSSRFPYYMNTYGFHSIHGRAPAIATGIKINNPELSVWVATGDGDLMSIGGNHFIHTVRRNIDIKIMLFNNRIYGLTKGQYSPTSEFGKKTKSSPFGTIDYPFNPVALALGSGATFVARSFDKDPKHLFEMIKRAATHKGTTFIEVLQNCAIFNDGAYNALTNKDTRDDNLLYLEHGKPMLFGKNKDKGIMLDCFQPKIIDIKEESDINKVWVHDEFDKNIGRSTILSHFGESSEFPTPVGIFRQITKPTYDAMATEQIETAQAGQKDFSLSDILLKGANTWKVEE